MPMDFSDVDRVSIIFSKTSKHPFFCFALDLETLALSGLVSMVSSGWTAGLFFFVGFSSSCGGSSFIPSSSVQLFLFFVVDEANVDDDTTRFNFVSLLWPSATSAVLYCPAESRAVGGGAATREFSSLSTPTCKQPSDPADVTIAALGLSSCPSSIEEEEHLDIMQLLSGELPPTPMVGGGAEAGGPASVAAKPECEWHPRRRTVRVGMTSIGSRSRGRLVEKLVGEAMVY